MRIVRRVVSIALLVCLALLGGCVEPVEFNAVIEPSAGHVPYVARIACTPPHGTYTVELPNGTSVTTEESEISVTVDRLEWEAEVRWTDGKEVRVDTVTATGTNAPPTILPPRLNGNAYQSSLRAREATLIDFTHYAGGLSGPESGVVYDGPWQIVSIRLEAGEKVVCGAIMADSVYTPPYENGVYHATFGGQLWENACLVYPLVTMETAPNGRPYAPEPLVGYTYDGARNRNVLLGVQFPEQTATIQVVVEDDWGRRTSASFPIRVAATGTGDSETWGLEEGQAPNPGQGEDPTLFQDADFYVSGVSDPHVHRRTCVEVCRTPGPSRVYYLSEENARTNGKILCPICFEE